MTEQTDYEYRHFSARVDDGVPDAATTAWLEAEFLGFHAKRPTPKHLRTLAEYLQRDEQRLTGVYAQGTRAPSLGSDYPVATFSSFERTLTVSPDRQLPARLISSVTVRPTHRRRGILRRMMTDNLEFAHREGYAIAALTASEGSIYRRFGFGMATWEQTVEVTTDSRFRLLRESAGSCELVEASELLELAPRLFEPFHLNQTGSVDRHSSYPNRVSGVLTEDGEEDRGVRAALHFDAAGEPDGYVSYRFAGWQTDPPAIEVVDFVAQNDDAYLGLWQYLASIDLVSLVKHERSPIDDPLRFALVDSRVVRVKHVEDLTWLRILDPVAALQAREYDSDGEIVLRITDELGYAEGTIRLAVASGAATVTRLESGSPADIELDASGLASLYLGGVEARMLIGTGQLTERRAGGISRLGRILRPLSTVHSATHF